MLHLPKEHNRLKVDPTMAVATFPGVWALGDRALIPDDHGGYQPPTAQHASREGKVLANNIAASVRGDALKPFRFKTLGLLASIGRRTGVARMLGFNFSGFVAWWLWRTIYVLKLPRIEKKLRVALDWTLDVFFSKDLAIPEPTFTYCGCRFVSNIVDPILKKCSKSTFEEPQHTFMPPRFASQNILLTCSLARLRIQYGNHNRNYKY
jgi:hypothetical protein